MTPDQKKVVEEIRGRTRAALRYNPSYQVEEVSALVNCDFLLSIIDEQERELTFFKRFDETYKKLESDLRDNATDAILYGNRKGNEDE